MWEFIRRVFKVGSGNPPSGTGQQTSWRIDEEAVNRIRRDFGSVHSMPLDQLKVVPGDREDFDAESCLRLLRAIVERRATTVNELLKKPVVVPLEYFFEGNRCKHSIAANVLPQRPFDTAEAWYNHLKHVHAQPGVQDVLVEISQVEPYEDGTLRMWPYSDRIWVYASLGQDAVAELLAPLEPDEMGNAASSEDDGWNLTPPMPAPEGVFPYWAWWD